MNPYLRIKQPIRPSTYLYTRYVLGDRWPEMEPESSTPIIPRVEILTKSSLDASRKTAQIIMGVFLGNELLGEATASKTLKIKNDIFQYTKVWSPMIALLPSGKITFNLGAQIYGDQILTNDIQHALQSAYEVWHPTPPEWPSDAAPALYDALVAYYTTGKRRFSIEGTRRFEVKCLDNPSSAFVAYAIWKDGGFVLEGTPIFIVGTPYDPKVPEFFPEKVYFDPRSAIEAAYSMCESRWPNTPLISEQEITLKINELETHIQNTFKNRGLQI